jgi:Leucine-rich repeat (LRR) protein
MIEISYKNPFFIIAFIFFITQYNCSDKNKVLDEYLQIDKYLYYKDDILVLEKIISNSCKDVNNNNLFEYSECSIDSIYDENNNGIVDPLEVGVTEWGENRRLIVLFAPNRGLSGIFPESIWNLTKLKKLDLRNNQLTGKFPRGIENLNNIKEIWLDNNSISGEIYDDFNILDSLTILSIQNNLFTSISDSLCETTDLLIYFSFSGNKICDVSELSDCTLDLIHNTQDCE